ncbi:MAG: ribosomal protein S18-alanine N-acetyltransferase [Clostridiales bacterium]|nr:ribosomal protein S18-alanine N-acetyltransferase [Clostridiales bacterium]
MIRGEISVRRAEKADAPIIAQAERAYIDCPWTEGQIEQEIDGGAVFLVAEIDGEFCGYVSGEVTADECEISNIAVTEAHRRKGVGKTLLTALLSEISARNVKSVYLLVRDGNTPAIMLYQSLGFTDVGRRKNYYKGKDALIMRLNL